MHRKPTTRWLPKVIKAFLLLLPIEEADLASMERYYRMNWPPRRDKNSLRTSLYTLLNNWDGELDRANVWNEAHPDKPNPRKFTALPLKGEIEPYNPTPEDVERTEQFMAQYRARKKPGDAFREAKAIMKGGA